MNENLYSLRGTENALTFEVHAHRKRIFTVNRIIRPHSLSSSGVAPGGLTFLLVTRSNTSQEPPRSQGQIVFHYAAQGQCLFGDMIC